VSIAEEPTARWARERGLSFTDYADLAGLPEVRDLIWRAVDAINHELPPHEAVKKIALLPEDLTLESGALTPSLKLKRRVVEERYQEILDAFYAGSLQKLD
jgi:long-chain acyl-CoA synthetase